MAILDAFRRRSVRVATATVVAVVVFTALFFALKPAPNSEGSGNAIGNKAPAWSGPIINGSGSLSSQSTKGQWVILNFFATWCRPCQQETPGLVQFATAHHGSKSVRLVGIVYQDEPGAVRSFAATHGVSWPLLSNPKAKVTTDYAVLALPQTVVIDPKGVVVDRFTGGVTADLLNKAISGH